MRNWVWFCEDTSLNQTTGRCQTIHQKKLFMAEILLRNFGSFFGTLGFHKLILCQPEKHPYLKVQENLQFNMWNKKCIWGTFEISVLEYWENLELSKPGSLVPHPFWTLLVSFFHDSPVVFVHWSYAVHRPQFTPNHICIHSWKRKQNCLHHVETIWVTSCYLCKLKTGIRPVASA